MKKVSVIIPTYNRGAKLLDSVNSVLQQTYSNIEVIVVDDGSTDNTQEVVESIADERVKYLRLPQNMGASAARNAGAEYAESDIIAFEDSDDLWRSDKLEKQMLYWEKHPDVAMIYCTYLMHKDSHKYVVPEENLGGELEGDIFLWLLQRNSIGAPTMVMYRDCFLEVGGFDVTMRSMEDWEFAIRFSEQYRIGYLNEILVDAIWSDGGVSSKSAPYYDSRCKMIARYKKQLEHYGLFDMVVNDLLHRASERNILDVVKKMLMLYLSGK